MSPQVSRKPKAETLAVKRGVIRKDALAAESSSSPKKDQGELQSGVNEGPLSLLETHHVPLGLYGECREGLRVWRPRREKDEECEECVILRRKRN